MARCPHLKNPEGCVLHNQNPENFDCKSTQPSDEIISLCAQALSQTAWQTIKAVHPPRFPRPDSGDVGSNVAKIYEENRFKE